MSLLKNVYCKMYTEEALYKLDKRKLTGMLMLLQNKVELENNDILEEIRKLYHKYFTWLEAIVAGQKYSLLKNRLLKMDWECWGNA